MVAQVGTVGTCRGGRGTWTPIGGKPMHAQRLRGFKGPPALADESCGLGDRRRRIPHPTDDQAR
eukprot:3086162-Alexandrium_andersonii.AAC.1